jgi:superfamily II DNA/RNA helicase
VHFDPPADHKDYLHRSGRTARAGATGTVVSFVEPQQRRDVTKMHAAAKVEPTTATVRNGHPAVRAIAESGEPIVVVPLPTRPAQTNASNRPPRSAGHGRRAPQRHRTSQPRRKSA